MKKRIPIKEQPDNFTVFYETANKAVNEAPVEKRVKFICPMCGAVAYASRTIIITHFHDNRVSCRMKICR